MKSFRSLLGQPLYVVLSVATLTLAVGANLVVFTIVNAIWIRPRPVHHPDRVVMVMGDTSSLGSSERFYFAELGLQLQVRDVPAFELVAGQVMTSGRNASLMPRIAFDAIGHPVETLGVTSEYFGVLGIGIRGRDFTRDDDRYGAAPVAIISDRLWKTAFRGEDIVGADLPASPVPIRIIGIAPPGFSGARLGENADLWIPRNLVPFVSLVPRIGDGSPVLPEGAAPILAIARLRPGISAAEAERLIEQHGKSRNRLAVVPLSQIFGSPHHRTLIIDERNVLRLISAAAALVLFGGCATLMALVFAHYERRRSEFGIRLALGASATRLAGRMTSELGWLVAGGSLTAVVAAALGLEFLPALSLPGGIVLDRLDLGFDWRVLLAGIAGTVITMSAAAALPMRRFTSHGIAAGLISSVATAARSSLRLRQIALGAQVTATVAVLAGAGLFLRTMQHGFDQGPGFDAARTVFIDVDTASLYDLSAAIRMEGIRTSAGDFKKRLQQVEARLAAQRLVVNRRIVDAVKAQPGVELIAVGTAPLGVDSAPWLEQPSNIETESGTHALRVGYAGATPGYLHALGLRVIAGRALVTADGSNAGAPRTVMITASLAAALWPGESAVGRRFRMSADHEVVGVVDDFAFGSLRFDPPYVVLAAAAEEAAMSNSTLKLVVRTPTPTALVAPLRRTITQVLPDSPRMTITTGREAVAADLARERLGAWFFSGFGLVATGLGIGGVFGMVAYMAEFRRREFGIRAALGATMFRLALMIIIAGLAPVVVGTAAGLLGALWLGKAAESFLIGVSWFDPVSYWMAGLVMLGSATLAGFAAAWRIKRIAPSEALRAE